MIKPADTDYAADYDTDYERPIFCPKIRKKLLFDAKIWRNDFPTTLF